MNEEMLPLLYEIVFQFMWKMPAIIFGITVREKFRGIDRTLSFSDAFHGRLSTRIRFNISNPLDVPLKII